MAAHQETEILNSDLKRVGVGIMFAHNPLRGSGQAGFPHPALALGNDAHAAQGIGMTDGRRRQPASDRAPHAAPEQAAILTAPRQRAVPEPSHLEPKDPQRFMIHGHTVIPHVSTYHRLRSCERLRMTRGRCGSLLHIRMTFAFTTPRRFNRRTGEDS
jgi:hypothetical protein